MDKGLNERAKGGGRYNLLLEFKKGRQMLIKSHIDSLLDQSVTWSGILTFALRCDELSNRSHCQKKATQKASTNKQSWNEVKNISSS